VEIGLILTPVVTIIWVMPLLIAEKPSREQINLYLVIMTILIGLGLNLYRREGPDEIGLRLDNLTQAMGGLFGFTLVGSVTVAIGLAFGSVNTTVCRTSATAGCRWPGAVAGGASGSQPGSSLRSTFPIRR
jgi:hypothetical protein